MSNKSIYKVIINDLSEMLESGALPPGNKVPSVMELQRKYGVSHLTALKALKTLALEKRIEFEKGKGYFARANKTEKVLGLAACIIRPSWEVNDSDNYFNDINQGIENKLLENGFSTIKPACCHLLMNKYCSDEIQEQIRNKIVELEKSVDGFLLDERISDQVIAKLKSKIAKPMVLVNRKSQIAIDTVSPDNFNGAEKAAEMAVKMGYAKFLVGRAGQEDANYIERTAGFILGLKTAGIPDGHIIEFDFNLRSYEEEFAPYEKHLEKNEKVLIFSPIDYFARWVAERLTAQGVILGSKTGVIGYDSIKNESSPKPLLATVNVNPSEVGCKAAEMLIRKINRQSMCIQNCSPESVFKMGASL